MAQRTDIRYIRYSHYTDGSAARKVAPMAPLKTIKLPRVIHKKSTVFPVDPVAFASIGMAVVMAVLIIVGCVRLNAAHQEVQKMSDYVQTLTAENAQLQKDFESGYDIEQIERTAIALGLVPREQVQHITVTLPQIEKPAEPTAWERFTTFLSGLFA